MGGNKDMNKLEVQNISKRFQDKLVLDNISFTVEEGEIFGLIGPNGAGKSTLINTIIGLLTANSGTISIDGKTIADNSVEFKKKIGLVPQDLALVEDLTAHDNLEYFGAYYGLFGKKLKERMEEAIEMSGLKGREKEKVKKFSGGLKRRLNVAVAMMHHPEIIIMDEPTVGVDAQSRNYIFDYIRKINKEENTTVIYTSHYMEEVEQLCSRLFIIDNGKKVSYGTKSEVKSLVNDTVTITVKAKDFPASFVGTVKMISGVSDVEVKNHEEILLFADASFQLNELINICQENQVSLIGIHIDEPTLEEVFLSLTGKRLRD